jgi:hypothetical protein
MTSCCPAEHEISNHKMMDPQESPQSAGAKNLYLQSVTNTSVAADLQQPDTKVVIALNLKSNVTATHF